MTKYLGRAVQVGKVFAGLEIEGKFIMAGRCGSRSGREAARSLWIHGQRAERDEYRLSTLCAFDIG